MHGTAERGGRLPENLVHFARVLRAAGLPVGPDRVLDALRATDCVGIDDRQDLAAALAAVLVDSRDQMPLFEEAFDVFWRDPRLLGRLLARLLQDASGGGATDRPRVSRRLADALAGEPGREPEEDGDRIELQASATHSADERLRHMDFEQMSTDELAAARAAVARMRLGPDRIPVRRLRPDPAGRHPDPRATVRGALRGRSNVIELVHRTRQTRPPTLVLLCDISGSMSAYARIVLQFAHALTAQRPDVHTLLFGTRLTPVTFQLRRRDPDAALQAVGRRAPDWSGGTRIGAALGTFNRDWGRRLLGRGAIVLLVTDGLDRDAAVGIGREMGRLRRSASRLIWLNPLLRYDGFEVRAAGIRALLPHVDELRPVHNLRSLEQLARALAGRMVTEGERNDLRRAARRR